jgi:hypothetical protein
VSGYQDTDLLTRAKSHLSTSLQEIDTYFKSQLARHLPRKLSWPRRLLLFYLPRSWWAGILHTFYQAGMVLIVLLIYGLGFFQSDNFELGSLFIALKIKIVPLLLFTTIYYVFMLRYIAVVKDQWDDTIPVKTSSQRISLIFTYSPVSWRDLMARIILIGAAVDIVYSVFFRLPELDPGIAALIPIPPIWMKGYWISVEWLTPPLAYWWARVEYDAEHLQSNRRVASRSWFPRKSLSPPDWLLSALFLYLLIDPVLTIARAHRVFDGVKRAMNLLVQQSGLETYSVDFGSAFAYGMLSSTAVDIFWSFITLYAIYRIALVRHLTCLDGSSLQNAATKTSSLN